ncbi:MAG: hypothetical protein AMXMBFR64_49850 [Myxococcales bacterium]
MTSREHIEAVEAELRAARRTIDALVRRQLHESSADVSGDRYAVVKAMSTLEGVVAKRTTALRASEQRYRTLYDHAPDLYATIDGEGRVLRWNETFARTLDLPAGVAPGGFLKDHITEESAARLSIALEGDVDGRLDVGIDLVRADGVIVSTTMRAVRLPQEAGEAAGQLLLTFRDVADKLRLEQELAHAQRLAAVGALAAGVAHEINNPLTVVRGQADLLAMAPALSDDLRTRAVTIRDHAMRIAGIVSNLQTFAGRDGARGERVRVLDVLRDAAEITTTRHPATRIGLHTGGLHPSVEVIADRQRLAQALLNLLDNAGDHGSEHLVEVVALGADDVAVIEVRDRGPGIRPEHRTLLFSPFFTTKGVGEGSGLGLAVSYGIIRELGGHIQAENRNGGGAIFRVTLPVAGRTSVVPARPMVEEVAGGGRVAMVVDDEPVIRELVATILRDAGYGVLAFGSGLDALESLAGEAPDVVLTDVRMPGMDGLALREALISRYPALTARVILMTGVVEYTQRQDIPSLPKPFSREELLHAVGSALK